MQHYNSFLKGILFLFLFGVSVNIYAQKNPIPSKSNYDYVDPFIGTKDMGHTFPGACTPFGMVQLSPETDTVGYLDNGKYNPKVYRYCAGYQYADKTIVGFAHTHYSGTGHSDLGDFLIIPTIGKLQLNPGTADNPKSGYRSTFNHKDEVASPGYYRVKLDRYNVLAELTASCRVGFHQYTFPATDSAHIILDMNYGIYNYPGKVLWSSIRIENDTLVTGYRITQGFARTRYIYFAMSFSKPFKKYGYKNFEEFAYKGSWRRMNQYENFPEMVGKNIKAYFDFSTSNGEKIKIKMAISSVSTEGALKNLYAEIPGWDFDKTRALARALWETEFNKINISAPEDKKIHFYTSLYHSYIIPVTYNDVDGNYRGLDGNIHKADNYTNYTVFSLWDTYRALHPYYTIMQPKRDEDIIHSMLDHYDQSVHKVLPMFGHFGNEAWGMIGYHAVPVIADAYIKGLHGFDGKKALEACVSSANNEPMFGIKDYIKYGYAPFDKVNYSASITLEYAYDDFTIACLAKAMNRPDIEKQFMQRAKNFRNIFDHSTGFMRAKDSKGNWKTPVDMLSTDGQGFIEGNAWTYTLYVPQDIKGYIKLLGGDNILVRRLDSLFTMHLDDKFFENTEDVTREGMIGAYDHGNEPSHHIAYMYVWTNQPWKTQERIPLIMNKMYRNTPDGLCGNDDCGQMSAWYILSAFGFYPVCPATSQYVFGSPYVNEAKLNLPNGKTFIMKALNLDEKNIYIQSVMLNGKPYAKTYITHSDIVNGGELIFKMGSQPNKKWGVAKEDKPYSISDYE